MVKSKLYSDYTMEEMVDRVIYWWVRYEGTRTEDGKEFSKSDVTELAGRLKILATLPLSFDFNKPEMYETPSEPNKSNTPLTNPSPSNGDEVSRIDGETRKGCGLFFNNNINVCGAEYYLCPECTANHDKANNDWYCDFCSKGMPESESGIAYSNVAFCSQDCINKRMAEE